MLASGEIIRDSRVVYVNPASELKIKVKADKDVYLPGEEGKITFEVTDAQGKPTPAALGVLIVDEAVYALQEMQPGLEKVYFTLQEELLKPKAHVLYKPSENLNDLVREPVLADDQAASRRGPSHRDQTKDPRSLGGQPGHRTAAEVRADAKLGHGPVRCGPPRRVRSGVQQGHKDLGVRSELTGGGTAA